MESIQVLINTINNAQNFEALKGQLVVALTQVYENGGGGESGTWVPTPSDVTNDATVTLSSGIYSRVGDIVNFSLNCNVEMAVDQPATTFTFNLPIASAFTDAGQLKAAISGTLQDTSFDPPSPLYRVNISAGTGVASVSSFNGQDVGATYAVNILGQYIVV